MDHNTVTALQPPQIPYHIRPVLMKDLPALCADVWTTYDGAYAEKLIDKIQKYAIEGRGLGVVVENNLADTPNLPIIAYGQMMLWTHCAEISDLIVSEAWRSRGIGTAMIQFLVQRAQNMFVTCVEIGVADSNQRALALYQRLGFEVYHQMSLNVGKGIEPVTYLRLAFNQEG